MDDRKEIAVVNKPAMPVAENDPRVILAAERTLLAWIRTGLAMMGFGFLVAKFGLFLSEVMILKGRPPTEAPKWSMWIGAALVVIGVVVTFVVGLEHLRYQRALLHESLRFQTGYRMAVASAIVLAAVGGLMVIRLILL